MAAAADAQRTAGRHRNATEKMSSSDPNRRMTLSELNGMAVRGRHGEIVGEIEELIVDVRTGAIDGAELSLAIQRSSPALRITVPWSQLRLSENGTRLELGIGLPTLIAVATRRAAGPKS
jgi:sporulation protein YlmC with PRC-barrel domain